MKRIRLREIAAVLLILLVIVLIGTPLYAEARDVVWRYWTTRGAPTNPAQIHDLDMRLTAIEVQLEEVTGSVGR